MERIKEIMKKDIISVKRSTTLYQLIAIFKDFHTFPLVPVVDDNGMLAGVVYLKNIIEIFQPHHLDILKANPLLDRQQIDIFDLEIEPGMENLIIVDDIMEKNFLKVCDTQPLDKVYNLMQLHSKDTFPVVNKQEELVGIIGIFGIVMAILKSKGVIE